MAIAIRAVTGRASTGPLSVEPAKIVKPTKAATPIALISRSFSSHQPSCYNGRGKDTVPDRAAATPASFLPSSSTVFSARQHYFTKCKPSSGRLDNHQDAVSPAFSDT
jgi:hypothetical protein